MTPRCPKGLTSHESSNELNTLGGFGSMVMNIPEYLKSPVMTPV
jgi:hypothetical protein